MESAALLTEVQFPFLPLIDRLSSVLTRTLGLKATRAITTSKDLASQLQEHAANQQLARRMDVDVSTVYMSVPVVNALVLSPSCSC